VNRRFGYELVIVLEIDLVHVRSRTVLHVDFRAAGQQVLFVRDRDRLLFNHSVGMDDRKSRRKIEGGSYPQHTERLRIHEDAA